MRPFLIADLVKLSKTLSPGDAALLQDAVAELERMRAEITTLTDIYALQHPQRR